MGTKGKMFTRTVPQKRLPFMENGGPRAKISIGFDPSMWIKIDRMARQNTCSFAEQVRKLLTQMLVNQ